MHEPDAPADAKLKILFHLLHPTSRSCSTVEAGCVVQASAVLLLPLDRAGPVSCVYRHGFYQVAISYVITIYIYFFGPGCARFLPSRSCAASGLSVTPRLVLLSAVPPQSGLRLVDVCRYLGDDLDLDKLSSPPGPPASDCY